MSSTPFPIQGEVFSLELQGLDSGTWMSKEGPQTVYRSGLKKKKWFETGKCV